MRMLIALICVALAGSAAAQKVRYRNDQPQLFINGKWKVVHGQDVAELLFDCHPDADPCVIQDNLGGEPDAYLLGGYAARLSPKKYWVAGKCYSGCPLFIDIARAKVCLTSEAVLGFHQSYKEFPDNDGGKVYVFDGIAPYSQDVLHLVEYYGGFPAVTTSVGSTKIPAAEAKIWPMCKEVRSVKALAVTR